MLHDAGFPDSVRERDCKLKNGDSAGEELSNAESSTLRTEIAVVLDAHDSRDRRVACLSITIIVGGAIYSAVYNKQTEDVEGMMSNIRE